MKSFAKVAQVGLSVSRQTRLGQSRVWPNRQMLTNTELGAWGGKGGGHRHHAAGAGDNVPCVGQEIGDRDRCAFQIKL